ncbi:hypothetical protein SprV_0100107100 [Sparganum proliferum]
MEIATDLRDIIDCPPTEAPYTALKEALISRISLSTQKRLQRLISEEDLGDRKPTQFLRRLEQLADGQKLDATMFKQLFLQRLPPSVQAILAPNIPSSTVQTLAETADRILEYYQPPVTVNVASRSTIAPTIEDVVKRLDALTLEVSQLRATRGYNPPVEAFNRARKALADTTVLVHPIPDAPLSIVADASNLAIGAALQQQTPTGTQPLAFYSAKLTPPQTRYSTFGRELLAIYLAIKHFRNYIEGRDFCIYTDHKPLTYALSTSSDKYSPREARHLDFISQYTTDIRFLKGLYNQVADCLSRPGINAITRPSIDLERMAELQNQPTFIESLQPTSLQLEAIPLSTTPGTILCDVSRGASRPVVPSEMRRDVFATLHNLAHPGIRSTQRLVSERFVWPSMNTDIRQWTRSCLACQKAKVGRHNKAPIGTFLAPDARFAHVHIDLVGPFPTSRGCNYLLIAIDRFTRWPIATPIPNITADSVAHAFFEHWISHYGIPSTITTDRGQQFESRLFNNLTDLLGCSRIRTTAYHPSSNGLVERFHRQLKASLRAHDNPSHWSEHLPLVMLGIRTALKPDLECSAAELVYGTTLRIPGVFFGYSQRPADLDPSDYVQRLRQVMTHLRATPPRAPTTRSARPLRHRPSCCRGLGFSAVFSYQTMSQSNNAAADLSLKEYYEHLKSIIKRLNRKVSDSPDCRQKIIRQLNKQGVDVSTAVNIIQTERKASRRHKDSSSSEESDSDSDSDSDSESSSSTSSSSSGSSSSSESSSNSSDSESSSSSSSDSESTSDDCSSSSDNSDSDSSSDKFLKLCCILNKTYIDETLYN